MFFETDSESETSVSQPEPPVIEAACLHPPDILPTPSEVFAQISTSTIMLQSAASSLPQLEVSDNAKTMHMPIESSEHISTRLEVLSNACDPVHSEATESIDITHKHQLASTSTPYSSSKRFRVVSDAEINSASLKQHAENTKRATMCGVRAFEEFLQSEKNVQEPNWLLLVQDKDALVQYIKEFALVLQTKKKTGQYADPKGSTCVSYINGIIRYLVDYLPSEARYDVRRDSERWPSLQMVIYNRVTAVSKKTENCVENALALTKAEVEQMYASFNRSTAEGHRDSIILIVSCLIGERGGEELREMELGWFTLDKIGGADAVVYRRPTSSAKNGTRGPNAATTSPKSIAILDISDVESDPLHNPYMMLRDYILIAHPTKKPNDPFFYNVNRHATCLERFYKNEKMGKHMLSGYAKRVWQAAFGIEPPFNLRNHSFRAYMITQLLDSGESEVTVMKRSGHRSIAGVQSYNRSVMRPVTANRQQAILAPVAARPPVPMPRTDPNSALESLPASVFGGFNFTVNGGSVNFYVNPPNGSEPEKKA